MGHYVLESKNNKSIKNAVFFLQYTTLVVYQFKGWCVCVSTMRLFKILEALEKSKLLGESRLAIEGATKLEKYGRDVVSAGIHDLKVVNNEKVLLGGEHVLDISRDLRLGNLEAVKRVYKLNEVPVPLGVRLTEDVKVLPSFAVGESERIGVKFKDRIREKLPAKTFEELSSKEGVLKVEHVEQNPVLKDIIEDMKKKERDSTTGNNIRNILLAGGSIAAAVAVINARRAQNRGCFAYYYDDNGKLSSCRVETASCDGKGSFNTSCGGKQHPCNNCTGDILERIPAAMKLLDNCIGRADGQACYNCPPPNQVSADTPDISDSDDAFDRNTVGDTIYFKCNDPSILDTIGDIFGQAGSDLIDLVDSSLQGSSWIFRNLSKIFKYGGIILVIAVCLGAMYKFLPFFNRDHHRQNDHDSEESSSSVQENYGGGGYKEL